MNKYRIVETIIYDMEGTKVSTEYHILVLRSFLGIEWYEELTELNFYFGVYIQQYIKFNYYGLAVQHVDRLLQR